MSRGLAHVSRVLPTNHEGPPVRNYPVRVIAIELGEATRTTSHPPIVLYRSGAFTPMRRGCWHISCTSTSTDGCRTEFRPRPARE